MAAQAEHAISGEILAYVPTELVGRQEETQKIRQAVDEGKRVVLLEGMGGIGKTRMLNEAPTYLEESARNLVFLEILDFYDTAMHGSLALEEALAYQIEERDAHVEVFEEFFKVASDLRTSRIDDEQIVHATFAEAFKTWLGDRWAVLRFDTAEALEVGKDAQEVRDECEIYEEVAPAATWLQKHLREFAQTTALIAARPTLHLRESLAQAYADDLWCYLRLDTLSLAEARTFFNISEFGRQIDAEMVKRIWLLSDGRPILLSLAIDWLASGVRVDEIYDIDLDTLEERKESDGPAWEQTLEQFERALVGKFRLLNSNMNLAIYYAARARKGFTAEMLRAMLATFPTAPVTLSPGQMEALMSQLKRLSFVKQPHGAREGWYFLHDEMYDLVDRYVWQRDYPSYKQQASVARFLADEIYGFDEGDGLIGEAVANVREATHYVEMLQLRHDLETLRTERLFYQLEADPAAGYATYERLDVQAISQRRHEWDDMLRIEVLRFIHMLPARALQDGLVAGFDPETGEPIIADAINRGCRARWVHRFFARGRRKKAKRIAQKLLDHHPTWGGFWRARVLTTLGASKVRLGDDGAAKPLEEARRLLNAPDVQGDQWAIEHYRGTTDLYLGLLARGEGDLPRAEQAYGEARRIFLRNDEPIPAARAYTNLAYVWMLQGSLQRATQGAREAVRERREQGEAIGLALSLNTLAITENRAGATMRARLHAREALSLLRRAHQRGRAEPRRETAMVHINLVGIFRGLAQRGPLREIELVQRDWERAQRNLKEALERKESLEPYYRFDLHNQEGTLYKDWANWIALRDPTAVDQYEEYMHRADVAFERAHQLAQAEELAVEQADNLEDWAWVFHLRHAYRGEMPETESPSTLREETLTRLDKAEALLSPRADPGRGGLRAHCIMGSVHHQWGRYLHKFGDNLREALEHYALSVAYYDLFTPEHVERREIVLLHALDALEFQPVEDLRTLVNVMLGAVVGRHLPSEDLHRLLLDILMEKEGFYHRKEE